MIVLDTSVVSAFSEIKRFHLLYEILNTLGVKAVIPHTVENELIFPEVISSLRKNGGWIAVKNVQDYKKYLKSLHIGESGVIALAKKFDWIAALDDFEARKIARSERVRITGTLGIIKVGYERCPIKNRQELQNIIHELVSSGFFMTPDIQEEVFNTKKEQNNSRQD